MECSEQDTLNRVCPYTLTRTQAHAHTQTRARTRAHTQTRTQTCTHTRTHEHIHTHAQEHTQAHTSTHAHTHTRATSTHIHTDLCLCTRARLCAHACHSVCIAAFCVGRAVMIAGTHDNAARCVVDLRNHLPGRVRPICAGTGLVPCSHLRRDCATLPAHVCAGTGLAPPTSAPGLSFCHRSLLCRDRAACGSGVP
jgi:hypothetical protein